MENIATSAPFLSLSPTEQNGALAITALATLCLTISTIIAKIWLRGLDIPARSYDRAMLAGAILLVVQTACAIKCAKLGVGNHRDTIDERDLDTIRQYLYAMSLLGISINFCTKLSMCLFIRKINVYSPIFTANSILLGLVTAVFVSSIFSTAFPCQSPQWTTGAELDCPSVDAIYRYTLIASIITDILIVVLAALMVARVRTELRAKILVTSLFALRLVCPATTIPAMLDTSHLHNGGDVDFTWSTLSPLIWLMLSWNFAVMTACVPSLKGLFEAWLGNTFAMQFETSYELEESVVNSRPDAYTNISGSRATKNLSSFRSRESMSRDMNPAGERRRLNSAATGKLSARNGTGAITSISDPDLVTDAEESGSEHWQSESVRELTRRTSCDDCESGQSPSRMHGRVTALSPAVVKR